MSFTDDGFLATLFMDKNIPIMNSLWNFQLSYPSMQSIVTMLDLFSEENIYNIKYWMPNLKNLW